MKQNEIIKDKVINFQINNEPVLKSLIQKDVTHNILYQMKNRVIRTKSGEKHLNNIKNESQELELKIENYNNTLNKMSNSNNSGNTMIKTKLNRANSCNINKARNKRTEKYSLIKNQQNILSTNKYNDNHNDNSFYDINNYNQQAMIETKNNINNHSFSNIRPLEAAKTIYKELSRQKSAFYNQLISNNTNYKSKRSQAEQINTRMTCFLDRKDKSELPTIFPVYLSLNNKYDSVSEKKRHEKIMEKFIKLKVYTSRDPENTSVYIKEFFLKNGIIHPDYFTEKSLANFQLFLNKQFNFDFKTTIQEIIKNAVYNDSNTIKDFECKYNLMQESCVVDQVISQNFFQKKRIIQYSNIKRNTPLNSVNHEKLYSILNKTSEKKDLKDLVKDLEDEFIHLQLEGQKKMEKVKDFWFNPVKNKILIDKNIYVPNLCLSSHAMNKNIIRKIQTEKEKTLKRNIQQKKINDINQRMYYSKNIEINIEGIRRKNKLTEYIMLQRTRKKLFIEQQKNKNELKRQVNLY